MRAILLVILLGISSGLVAPRLPALQARRSQPAAPARSAGGELARRIPAVIQGAGVPGIQVGYVQDGKVAWSGAFGVANTDSKAPVTDESVFEAASLSKPVFAYAVLKLVDAGRLDLDAPLVSYLPGPYDVGDDARLAQVTARHVLAHRTGFPNWRTPGKPLTMHFAPGERYSYSGEGYVYLAAVVERITGETLDALMKRSVFDPLGMAGSSYVWQPRYDALKVYNHDQNGQPSGRGRPWRANAAASLQTTARDFARFLAAVVSGQGLKAATWKQMMAVHSRVDEIGPNTVAKAPAGRQAEGLAWGLGWGLAQDGDLWQLWHWGDNGNTKAFVVSSPARRDGLVLFANSRNGLSIVEPLLEGVWTPSVAPALRWLDVAAYRNAAARQDGW